MPRGGYMLLTYVERILRNRNAVIGIIAAMVMISMMRGDRSGNGRSFGAMTDRYCNAPVDEYDYVISDEGRYRMSSAKLVAVTVTVRHGDRSAIHLMPGSVSDPVFDCKTAWPRSVVVASEETTEPLSERQQKSATLPTGACLPGQLTALGMEQLQNLGEFIRKAYQDQIDIHKPVYARSTDYSRTLLSGASFLRGFSSGADTVLRVFEDEDKELMHGVGLRGQSAGSNQLAKDSNGERLLQGTCERAAKLSKAQMARYHKPGHLATELAALFGASAAEKGITDLADAIHAGACHQMPLPCGGGGCLSPHMAGEVLQAADDFYCQRFTGDHGGATSSRVSMYPFLQTISDGLQAAADNNTDYRMRFYFGHDTVIAPLLAALGAYDCRWPPYAARVSFELWHSQDVGYAVRVISNGRPVTHLVRGCGGKDPCPLARFRRVVKGLIKPYDTKETACADTG